MRYAVLSDIHSNLEALTAVLEALASERIDRTLCLGDVVGYGADPRACLERLQACDALVVGGNHDAVCVGKLDLGWFNETAQASLVWTRDQLSVTDLDWLRRLLLVETVEPFTPYHEEVPPAPNDQGRTGPVKAGPVGRPSNGAGRAQRSIPFQQVGTGSSRGAGFTLVHGSLSRPERFEYLVDLAQIVDTLTTCRTLMCLAGHTHQPCFVEYDRTQRTVLRVLTRAEELATVAFRDDAATVRYLVNPGSVGQPRDGDPRASVAVIDTDEKRLSIHRVRYDLETAARKIRQAGLPGFFADRLAVGR